MYFDKIIKFIYDSVFDGEIRVIYYQYYYQSDLQLLLSRIIFSLDILF